MQAVGRRRGSVRAPVVAALLLLAAVVAGCGSDGGSDASDDPTTTAVTGSGTAENTETSLPGEGSTTLVDPTATSAPASTSTAPELADASEAQRSAAAEGEGTSLLSDVRLGVHDGYERITFEFTGASRPGYRIQWVDGPITADGSGEPVEVAGDAYLEVIMQPASGFDMETGVPTYSKADRIPTVKGNLVLADLVRTGDFEAVLTWVAGAKRRVPFAVSTFSSPTRLVIDLQSPEATVGGAPNG